MDPRQNHQVATRDDRERAARDAFAKTVNSLAERELVNLFGSEQGRAAAARVALAFRAAAATAKDPQDFYGCSPESVASALATSAFTQIMPGGPYTGCYLVPKAVNGVQTLNWWINHRGIKTLARRAGQAIEAAPYFPGDEVVIIRGKNWRVDVVEGDCEDRDDIENLLGFVYHVTDLETGMLLAARTMSRSLIMKRRGMGMTNGPSWRTWPMEMAEKSVIKYAAGRGDVFFDDVGNMALSREAEVIDAQSESISQTREQTTPARGRAALGMDNAPPVQDFAAEAERLRKRDAVPVASEQAAPEQQAKQEPAAPTKAAKPKVDGIPNKGQLLTRLAAIGITLDMAVAHVATPDAAWGADELRALKQLGIDVAEGRVALESLSVNDDPLAESGGGEEP